MLRRLGLARSGDGKVAGDGVGIVSVGEQRERAQILLDKSESDPDELLMQSGRFLEMLADLAQADDVPTCRLVTRCLANLAGHERMRVNLVQAGLLRSIVQAGQHEDTRVSTPASSALNLLGVYSVHTLDRLVQMTGVETLRYLCQCSDPLAQRAAAAVLVGVITREGHAMDEDDFRSVVHLGCSADPHIQDSAGLAVQAAVDYLSSSPSVVTKIVDEGSIIPSVVRVVLDGSQATTASLRLLAASMITSAITQESFCCRGCSQEPIKEELCWKLEDGDMPVLPVRAMGVARLSHAEVTAVKAPPTRGVGPNGEVLPPGWMVKKSRTKGTSYYVHKASGRSQWEFPLPEGAPLPAALAQAAAPAVGTPSRAEPAERRADGSPDGDAAEGTGAIPLPAEEAGTAENSVVVPAADAEEARAAEQVAEQPQEQAAEGEQAEEAVALPQQPAPAVGVGLGLELIAEPEPEPEPEEVTPPRPDRPWLARTQTPQSASPRTRSQRRLTARYTEIEKRSPFLCAACMHGLDAGTRERLEQIPIQNELRTKILDDGGHRALLALAQAWWHNPTDYNEAGQLIAEAKELQEISLEGLASLATSAATACELVAEGALTILVGLLDPFGPPPRPELRVLRSAARALANIACSARKGTWQSDAIGSAIFGTDALMPLLQLCSHSDIQVARHVARALAELSVISVRPGLANVDDNAAAFTPTSNVSSSWIPSTAGALGMSAASLSMSSMSSMFTPLSKTVVGLLGGRKMLGPSSAANSASSGRQDRNLHLPNICQNTDEIAWLLTLAIHHDVVIQRSASTIFLRLGRKASKWLLSAEKASGGEVLDVVFGVLGSHEDELIRANAMRTLEALTRREQFAELIMARDDFARVALSTRTPEEVRSAAAILANVGQAVVESDQSSQEMVGEMLSAALQVLRTDNDDARTEISWFIARVCQHQLAQVVADVGRLNQVCQALLEMMRSGDEVQMLNATEAVAKIATDETGSRALTDMQAQAALLRVMEKTKSDQARSHAVSAMKVLYSTDGSDQGVADPRASDASDTPAEADRARIPPSLAVAEEDVELLGRISSGQFGDVYKGKYQETDVAVKQMKCGRHNDKKQVIQSFEQEVELLATVRHPNICMVMGAVAHWPQLCIITELCHRGSLYHILQSKKKIPWYRRIALAKDAATGVNVLHRHQPCIVHLDLKSPNLLVDRHWGCKVADFGLSQTKQKFYVSDGCGGVGTPEWTAPEILKGEKFNEKADVYSFGVILWEMASRLKPWKGLMQVQVVVAVGLKGERLPAVTAPEATSEPEWADYNRLMRSAMSKEQEERPTMAEIRQGLEPLKASAEAAERQRHVAARGSAAGRDSLEKDDSPARRTSAADE